MDFTPELAPGCTGADRPVGPDSLLIDAVKPAIGRIDYVLVHELCRLEPSQHDRGFRQHLDRRMPR